MSTSLAVCEAVSRAISENPKSMEEARGDDEPKQKEAFQLLLRESLKYAQAIEGINPYVESELTRVLKLKTRAIEFYLRPRKEYTSAHRSRRHN